jgi:anaerobic C4-dicarboxylate transporter DcuA
MAIAVIASQQAITASPVSAATAAMIGLLAAQHIGLVQILMICVPSTLIAVFIASLVQLRVGKELKDDPEHQNDWHPARLSHTAPLVARRALPSRQGDDQCAGLPGGCGARRPGWPFRGTADCPRSGKAARPFDAGLHRHRHDGRRGYYSHDDQSAVVRRYRGRDKGALCPSLRTGLADFLHPARWPRCPGARLASRALQRSSASLAWLGDTFINANREAIIGGLSAMATAAPWTFAFGLFFASVLLYSQAATARALMPLGLSLGIWPLLLVGMFPAVNGYFLIPNYGTIIAAINFDRSGTTRIGKYVINHSFLVPGLVSTTLAVAIGLLIGSMIGIETPH